MKPFVDYLPDWLDEVDLTTKDNYRYKFAVENFHRIEAARKQFPDAVAWAAWIIKDNLNQEPTRRFPCCRHTGGGGWKPSAEECFPRIRERSAETTDGLDGRSVQLFRFSLGISVLEEYAPKSPEWIDSQAAKRREKKQKKERESMPLFSDQIAELQEEQSAQ